MAPASTLKKGRETTPVAACKLKDPQNSQTTQFHKF